MYWLFSPPPPPSLACPVEVFDTSTMLYLIASFCVAVFKISTRTYNGVEATGDEKTAVREPPVKRMIMWANMMIYGFCR